MKIIAFDCDSTLSAIEGVDELAALRGHEVEQQVIKLTNAAMNGDIPLSDVFARRLELIKPSLEMCHQISHLYLEKIVTGVRETLKILHDDEWKIIIISGGYQQAIEPFANKLGIEEVFAVPLFFHKNGAYRGYDQNAPTSKSDGKKDIIATIKKKDAPDRIVMVGDGISDLETAPIVDRFIGFGGVSSRPVVKKNASAFTTSFPEILDFSL